MIQAPLSNTTNVGVIGTGWCGEIRAVACAGSPLVGELHIAEVRQERLDEVAARVNPATATNDWTTLVGNSAVDTIIISATPESLHFPMAKQALEAGQHVLLEKPIAVSLPEADELLALATERGVKFTIGYSQRFNPKQAYAKQEIDRGNLGDVTNILVSRHATRRLGEKISSRSKLTPGAMEGTHDLDFALWCLAPRRPVRVFAQNSWGVRRDSLGVPDAQHAIVTMDDGSVVTMSAGLALPPSYPNYVAGWIEVHGTDGVLFIDLTHRDVTYSRVDSGVQFPLSTMPGEFVDTQFAGPMVDETLHFLEAVTTGGPTMVSPEAARTVMEVYLAVDLSAELGEVIDLPLSDQQIASALELSLTGQTVPKRVVP